jgi:hypothetical protein
VDPNRVTIIEPFRIHSVEPTRMTTLRHFSARLEPL